MKSFVRYLAAFADIIPLVGAFIGTGATAINNCGRAGFEALQARFTFQNDMCAPANILRTRAMAVNAPDEEVKGIDVSAPTVGRTYCAASWHSGSMPRTTWSTSAIRS